MNDELPDSDSELLRVTQARRATQATQADAPPTDKPLFLDPARAAAAQYVGDPNAVPNFQELDEKEADPQPNKPLKPRHREVARLHAMGKTNNEICDKLNYSTSRVSVLLHTAPIQQEVDRYRNKLYDTDLVSQLKELGTDAVGAIEEVLRDPQAKGAAKVQAAQWLIEKLTGKARQSMDLESNSLASFMEILQTMRAAGNGLAPIDVTPDGEMGSNDTAPKQLKQAQPDESKFDSWVDTEL